MTYVLLFAPSSKVLVPSLEYTSSHLFISCLALDLVAILVLAPTKRGSLHESIRDVDLDVGCTLEKSLVQVSCPFSLGLFDFKVNVRLRVSGW